MTLATGSTILVLGFVAGVLSGLFGIGGGLVIVPALVIVAGLDQKTATGTSLFALLLPVGFFAVRGYYLRGQARLDYGLLIIPGLVLGAYIGQKITGGMSDLMLKRVYACFLLVVSAYYFLTTTPSYRALIQSRKVEAKP